MLELVLHRLGSNVALKRGRPVGKGPGWPWQQGGGCGAHTCPPKPPGRQVARHSTALVLKGATHSMSPYHTHQVLYASRIPQITGSKTIKQLGRRKPSGVSFMKGVRGERAETLSVLRPQDGDCSGSRQPKPLQASAHGDVHPGPRDQWRGGFEGASGCLGGVTARLGVPVG